MNGLEFKYIRKKLKVTQKELAKQLFVTPRTIIKYEKNENIVPYSNEQLLLSILEKHTNKTLFANDPTPPNEINEPKTAYVLKCQNCEKLEKEVAHLQERLQDKEDLIEMYKSLQSSNKTKAS